MARKVMTTIPLVAPFVVETPVPPVTAGRLWSEIEENWVELEMNWEDI